MKNEIPKFILVVSCLAITALLTGLVLAAWDDNKATYAEASSYISQIQNKNKDLENDGWTCPSCGRTNDKYDVNCASCGKKNPWRND